LKVAKEMALMEDRLLTADEAAERLRAAPNTLRYWRYTGDGPRFIRVGRKVLYRESALNTWLQARESEDNSRPVSKPPPRGRKTG
jgi:predicted DNA-binding transcriptional regulator AlpA